MAYTAPVNFVSGNPLLETELNLLQDNFRALKDPPSDNYVLNEVSDYTTTSTTFVDVDATNLALTILTTGGDVLVHFHGVGTDAVILFDVDVDGVRDGGDDGFTRLTTVGPMSFTRLIAGLSAASHTFKLQWRVVAGTGTLYAGAGTSNADVHPQFWAREVS